MAELAEQMGRTVENHKSESTQPRSDALMYKMKGFAQRAANKCLSHICRERRGRHLHQVLPLPQVLRSHPHLGQARRLRHAAPRQEGVLRTRLQRRQGRAPLVLLKAAVRWNQFL